MSILSIFVYLHIVVFFNYHQVVDDVIPKSPQQLFKANWGNGSIVELGNALKPANLKSEPTVSWPYDASTLYTLVMVDPDAPSRTNATLKSVLHWLVSNVPANELAKGDVKATYVRSQPPKDTGPHRYTLLAYKQPTGRITYDTYVGFTLRINWNLTDFVAKQKLELVAGNFYQAEWDESIASN